MAAAAKKMPILLFTAQVVEGHTGPMLQIAEAMVKRGYEAVFVSAREFETKIQRLGAEYVATPGAFEMASPTFLEERAKLPPGPAKVTFEQEVIFFQPMARRTQIIQETLEKLRERTPDQQVIIVEEAASMSVYPFKYGRPLPNGFAEFPKTICINVIPLWLQSVDTGPFMLGLPQDSTESGRLRNQALNQLMLVGPLMQMVEMQKKYMREAGATSFPSADRMPLDGWITSMDVVFQMCSPELEYPRSDLPSHIHFAGCLPRKTINPDHKYPEWWPEIIAGNKKIVFVSQGTIATQYEELVIPTLEALDGRDEVIVVAALGVRGAKLPKDVKVPGNARVADYLLYDAVLEYADVFVSNGGYGSMTHSVVNAVPQVLAGETEDKNEVSMRVEWAGMGVNLKTQSPSPAQIRDGVDKILRDPKYKERALEIKKINEEMDCLSRIEKQILAFTE